MKSPPRTLYSAKEQASILKHWMTSLPPRVVADMVNEECGGNRTRDSISKQARRMGLPTKPREGAQKLSTFVTAQPEKELYRYWNAMFLDGFLSACGNQRY